jgi:hypothetical protein
MWYCLAGVDHVDRHTRCHLTEYLPNTDRIPTEYLTDSSTIHRLLIDYSSTPFRLLIDYSRLLIDSSFSSYSSSTSSTTHRPSANVPSAHPLCRRVVDGDRQLRAPRHGQPAPTGTHTHIHTHTHTHAHAHTHTHTHTYTHAKLTTGA